MNYCSLNTKKEMQVCECGCGGEPKKRYIHGHHPTGLPGVNLGRKFGPMREEVKQYISDSKLKKSKVRPPQLCGCGCGGMTKRGNKFIYKHHRFSEEVKAKFREQALKKWKDPVWVENFVQKWTKSIKLKPNKLELKFKKLLDEFFPKEWKYVGDGQIWIAGKCPDFFNVNGKKQLIELFGSYFHKPEDEKIRETHFAKYGYKTLFIWDKELNDPTNLIEKIRNF